MTIREKNEANGSNPSILESDTGEMPVPYSKPDTGVDVPSKNSTQDWEREFGTVDFLLDFIRVIACIISTYAAWRRWKSKKND